MFVKLLELKVFKILNFFFSIITTSTVSLQLQDFERKSHVGFSLSFMLGETSQLIYVRHKTSKSDTLFCERCLFHLIFSILSLTDNSFKHYKYSIFYKARSYAFKLSCIASRRMNPSQLKYMYYNFSMKCSITIYQRVGLIKGRELALVSFNQ